MPEYAEVFVEFLPSESGGRQTSICLGEDAPTRYRPHFRVKGGDGQYLGVEFVDGPDEPIQPGQRAFATVRFMYQPRVSYESLVVGAEFEILEGARTIGQGHVTRR